MGDFDRTKFSFKELTMNSSGKQSSSGFIGLCLGLTGAICFIAATVGYFLQIPNTLEVMGEVINLIAAASLLLGVRKVAGEYVASKNGKTTSTSVSTNGSTTVVIDPNKG
jgi:riboflavin transporter FmnP